MFVEDKALGEFHLPATSRNIWNHQKYYELARKRAPVVDKIGRVLLDAVAYIDQHGWCQGAYDDSWGHVCILGAIGMSDNNPVSKFRAKHRLRSYLKRATGSSSITGFNDSPARCLRQVRTALTEAASYK